MVYTMTSRASVTRNVQKHPAINVDLPASKRPRVGVSPRNRAIPLVNDSGINVNSQSVDPFDDGFTCDELLELEMVASQAESKPNAAAANENLPCQSNSFHFKPPQFAKNVQSSNFNLLSSKHVDDLVKSLQKRCSDYEQQINDMRLANDQKSGEVRLLRDKANDAERLLHEERQAKIDEARSKKEEKSQKEINLEKRVEAYKDQMEFKHAELQEAQHLIRNLELKNKSLVQEVTLASHKHKNFPDQEWGESSSQKKLKFIKPESPRILNKSKIFKDSNSSKPNNDKGDKPPGFLERRKACLIHSCRYKQEKNIILTSSQPPFLHVLNYCMEHRSEKCHADGCDAIQKMLGFKTNEDHKNLLEEASIITTSIKVLLQRLLVDCTVEMERLVVSSLEMLCILLESVDGLSRFIITKNEDTVHLLISCLAYNNCTVIKATLSLLVQLSKDFPPQKSDRFLPILAKIKSSLTSYDICTTSLVLDFLSNFISHCDIIKALLNSTIDEEPSLVSQICQLCLKDDQQNHLRPRFLAKVVEFLLRLTSEHDKILSELQCFAEIYHTVNIILYDSLMAQPTQLRHSLINKSICLIHSCTNVYPDGIPDLHSDHRHLLVLWKMLKFLKSQDDNFWNQELLRILKHEIEAVEIM